MSELQLPDLPDKDEFAALSLCNGCFTDDRWRPFKRFKLQNHADVFFCHTCAKGILNRVYDDGWRSAASCLVAQYNNPTYEEDQRIKRIWGVAKASKGEKMTLYKLLNILDKL